MIARLVLSTPPEFWTQNGGIHRHSAIDPRPEIPLDAGQLLALSLVLAVGTYHLYRKWQRGENASWDGHERRVTAFDVLLSATLCLAALAACAHEWLHAR
jgi:hypothetical protein